MFRGENNLVAVDGSTNPGTTLSKVVKGTTAHILSRNLPAGTYRLLDPSGDSKDTASAVGGEVVFQSVDLQINGAWRLERTDGSVASSFTVRDYAGSLVGIGDDEVLTTTQEQFQALLGGADYYASLGTIDYIHPTARCRKTDPPGLNINHFFPGTGYVNANSHFYLTGQLSGPDLLNGFAYVIPTGSTSPVHYNARAVPMAGMTLWVGGGPGSYYAGGTVMFFLPPGVDGTSTASGYFRAYDPPLQGCGEGTETVRQSFGNR